MPDRLDLPAIEATILRVTSLDLRTVDIGQMRDMLWPITLGMLHKSPIIKAGTDIRRGRIVSQRPRTIAEVSYPPAKAVRQLGRLNRIGQPVFYGSVSMHAPVYEINPKAGDFVVISRWRNHRDLLVNNVGYSQSNLRRLNPARPLPSFASEPAEDPRDTYLNDFFADAFCQRVPAGEEYRYKISITIGEVFFGSNLFDGLLYPSIVHPGTSDNIALKPGVVRSALDLVDCEYIEIKKAEKPTFEIEHVDFAKQIGSSGALDWKGRKPILQLRNQGDSVRVVSNGEEWFAYGPDGNRVDWE